MPAFDFRSISQILCTLGLLTYSTKSAEAGAIVRFSDNSFMSTIRVSNSLAFVKPGLGLNYFCKQSADNMGRL